MRYAALHYTCDEEKDAEWAADRKKGVPLREWLREMELDEKQWEGEPVFPTYRDDYHCPKKFRQQGIPRVLGASYWGGWDGGQSLTPAFVLLQVTESPFQIHALLEVTSEGSEPMERFAPRVQQAVRARLPGDWSDVRHYGDHTIGQRNGSTGETAQQVARKHGIEISLVSNTLQPRISAVEWMLNRDFDGTPGFLVDAIGCPLLREGFQGAYKLRTSAAGDLEGPGAVLLDPAKNMYSHVQDALQYPAVKIRALIQGTGSKMHK